MEMSFGITGEILELRRDFREIRKGSKCMSNAKFSASTLTPRNLQKELRK